MKKPNTPKETCLLIFIAFIVIAGIAAMLFKKDWQLNTKPSSEIKNKIAQENNTTETSTVTIISAKELKTRLDNKEVFFILDVQSMEDYIKKHIPNSYNIPYPELKDRQKELPNDKEIIVLCANNSSCGFSTKAAELLKTLGFSNIKDMKGGVEEWENLNYPTITEDKVNFQNISSEQLKEKIENNEDIYILDISDKQDFEISHIKNANNIPFEEVINKIQELPRNKQLIIYDKTGSRSKLIVETLTKKGFTQAINLIDGFIDWQNKQYPTEQ